MLHLLAGAILLAFSLLAVLPPQHNVLWILSIPAKEWGWVFTLLCLPVLWPWGAPTLAYAVGAAMGLTAAVLYLIPLLQGVQAARRLPSALGAPFSDPARPGDRTAPFTWQHLFFGVPAPATPVTTVTYATHAGVELKMDLTRPATGDPTPVVLVIHGGAWRSGDRKQLPRLNRYLTARGFATAAINYRLAPAHRFPAALEDVTAAVAYLKTHAGEHGIDPSRIVLLGRSAGGHLAVVAAFTLRDPVIRGAVSFYGPFGLEWGWDKDCKVLDVKTVMGDFLGGGPRDVPEAYRAASPYRLIHPDTPPVLMIQGEADVMVPPAHCDHLIEHLTPAGRPFHVVRVPQATHASDVNFSGPFGQIATWATERFLREVTR
ncbi:MAG TPA: alpha/beta hydrolase [Symbiobacteriaceae bacterium]|nr:alpha/beta hydrolase [Symbiobacteriaceae bacterium]